jgi:hypothetical protein
MANRSAHCCLCGQPRKPTQKPVSSFGNNATCISIKDHRPLQAGRWEENPQLIINVSIWRNGGTAEGETHICDDCIVVGLKSAKQFVETSLAVLAPVGA